MGQERFRELRGESDDGQVYWACDSVGPMHRARQPATFITLTRTVPHCLLALPHFRAALLGRGALDGHPRECSPPCHKEEPDL